MKKALLIVGTLLTLGLVFPIILPNAEAVPKISSILSMPAGPNDSQTVVITYQIPRPEPPASLDRVYLMSWQDGIRRHVRYKDSTVAGVVLQDTLRFAPPRPGHTSSYILGISTILKPLKPVRLRAFYWERTNNSVPMVTEPTILPEVHIKWSNPATAGVLGDSFRVWRRRYILPNDTIGGALVYQGTLFPGDTLFVPKDNLRIGNMYKFYGSVYLFGAERIRYPFFSVVVR